MTDTGYLKLVAIYVIEGLYLVAALISISERFPILLL